VTGAAPHSAGGLLRVVHPVEDRSDLGQDLGQVDRAHSGQSAEQFAARVGLDPVGEDPFELTDGLLEVAQEQTCALIMAARVSGGRSSAAEGARRSRSRSSAALLPPR